MAKEAVTQELIPLSEPKKWREALQGINHAFGHTWESCYAMHLTTNFPTYLYVLRAGLVKIFCPLAERDFNNYIDIVTPYGFSGFAGNQDFPDFQQYWLKFTQEQGYVSGYIGLNPLLENNTYWSADEVYQHNTLYVLNLQVSMTELFQQLSQNRRRQLKNFSAHQQHFTTDKLLLKEFYLAQHQRFFSEKKAAPVYNFAPATLSYLLNLENVLLVGYTESGQVKAVSVFAYTTYVGEYLFNVSLPGAQDQTAALLWYGLTLLKAKQIPYLNLGGGAQEGDSIAQFKQRFGAAAFPLKALKQVYNTPVYAQLCQATQADPANKSGYFPAYRQR